MYFKCLDSEILLIYYCWYVPFKKSVFIAFHWTLDEDMSVNQNKETSLSSVKKPAGGGL